MVKRAGFTGKMVLTKQISLLLLQSSLLVGSNQVETLGQVSTSSARKGHQAADQPVSVRTRLPRFLFFGVTTTTTTLSTTTMCWYSNVAITTTCSKRKRSLPDEEDGERERASSAPEELM